MSKQQTPLIEALYKYINEDITRYHMPGHKGGKCLSQTLMDNLAEMDVTEIPGLDNLHKPNGPIYKAQKLASQAFGSHKTWFLINGSTSGIHAMILAACPPGSSLIVPRNCHKSVINAMVLGDINPIYIQPEYDRARELTTQISLQSVKKALRENPHVVGVLVISPNYYGMCADIEEIGKAIHKLDKVLLVDEAHGAHFPFHPLLPPSAGELGADIWVHSAHKTLPSFTQTAYLHIKGERVDQDKVSQILSMVQTSSPSYILMASLDWAREIMVAQGKDELTRLIEELADLRQLIKRDLKIGVIDDNPWREVAMLDPTRLVLDFKGLGITGYKAEELLRVEEGLQIEMSDSRYGVFISTIGDVKGQTDKIMQACRNLQRNAERKGNLPKTMSISREIPRQMMSPRQAFYSKTEKILLNRSFGRICTHTFGAYPPGIPRYCPGELIGEDGIEELMSIHRDGGTFFGIDEDKYINVVKE
ncbi:MAG TPA: aminotransferase class V-fold PLP-dependent enzyme [Clostridia bacterium]|nr:aminotransferase class V-fold PLP-dependent enzyme [Clostridia bacterium]